MNPSTLNDRPLLPSSPSTQANRNTLLRLYLIRGSMAVVWAAVFARRHEPLDAVAIALLVIYPLIDAVSSLIDYRLVSMLAERRIAAGNATLGVLAAIALGVAASVGTAPTLATFGAWAVVAGAAQVMLGLRRRGTELGRQWPMLIAGALSYLVGINYGIQAVGAHPSLAVLSIYATGGGVFFLVQASLLAWRSRQLRPAVD